MGHIPIEHYRFRCDAPPRPLDSSPLCGSTSPTVEGQNLRDAAFWCEQKYDWCIVMGQYSPLFTYCPEHAHLGKEMKERHGHDAG